MLAMRALRSKASHANHNAFQPEMRSSEAAEQVLAAAAKLLRKLADKSVVACN